MWRRNNLSLFKFFCYYWNCIYQFINESIKLSRRMPSRVCDRRSFGKWFGIEFILFVGEMAYWWIGSSSEFGRTGWILSINQLNQSNEFHILQIHSESVATEFALELSSFLKELGCPYQVLVSGTSNHRYQTREDRSLLLNYLSSELMAAKMSHKLNPQKKVVIEMVSISFGSRNRIT